VLRYLLAVVAGLLLPVLGSAQCLTTLAPNPPFVPPIQYPPSWPSSHSFWYGTDALWTTLSIDGKWPVGKYENGSVFTTKLVFWARGFDWRKEPEPKLIVTGKRLDGDAPDVVEAHANAVFVPARPGMVPPGIMTGLDIPTAGCWEITAHYREHALTFIVSVEP
jgi:hypothetical protein